MKRIFSHPIAALAAGLCLRLFFVLKFPGNSGDTVLYEQIATNWLKHGTYAMNVGGALTPVDLRMPGYPAYLALVYAITGRTGAEARLWVMLGQVAVDLLGCLVTAALSYLLFMLSAESVKNRKRVFIAALWLAALCPFTANYTAVPLTEVFAVFLTGLALVFFLILMEVYVSGVSLAFPIKNERIRSFIARHMVRLWFLGPGLIVGVATLFRPESPLLLVAALGVLVFVVKRGANLTASLSIAGISAAMCVLPLLPWAVRNLVTLHEVQFLAPRDSNLPGELVPYGFMAWEKTWLYRMKDCYLSAWKLNDESIDVDSLPARAFDNAEEKQRVAAILEKYNDDLTLTAEEDAAFGQLARERNSRHPLRRYVWLPVARAVTMWFTPRIELVPVSGNVFPLKQMWVEDRTDQTVTAGYFMLNIVYVGLAVWGACRVWSYPNARASVVLLVFYMVLRTAFLTTLETPEPRYVLVCFPIVIAFAAQVVGGKRESSLPRPISAVRS